MSKEKWTWRSKKKWSMRSNPTDLVSVRTAICGSLL